MACRVLFVRLPLVDERTARESGLFAIVSRWLGGSNGSTGTTVNPIFHVSTLWLVTAASSGGLELDAPRLLPAAVPVSKFAERVRRQAQELASRPHVAPADDALPAALKDLDYDAYRRIVYSRRRALWRDESLPFQVQFFHRGYLFQRATDIHVVDSGGVETIPFSPALFEYGDKTLRPFDWGDIGFAGFRLLYPLNEPDKLDEVISFLGASYFRALGSGQVYGASARGLAIDTGLGEEEFPAFTKFWLEKPAASAREATVHALLESRSVTGAYSFRILPGEVTVVEVHAFLFCRQGSPAPKKIGWAPLTSMFLYGESDPRPPGAHRPEVHDSDGLLLEDGSGEWLWRPLGNPLRTRSSGFLLTNPRGFGLLQRDREPDHYRDHEARYHERPSIWVEALGSWGRGRVELLELSSRSEGYDNIAAFWVADAAPCSGGQAALKYRLHFSSGDPPRHRGGRVVAARSALERGGASGGRGQRFVVDFTGSALSEIAPEAPPEAVLTVTGAQAGPVVVEKDVQAGLWRVSFTVETAKSEAVELRLFLRRSTAALTETWSYQWNP